MIKTVTYKSGNILAYAGVGEPNGFPILVQHGLIASTINEFPAENSRLYSHIYRL